METIIAAPLATTTDTHVNWCPVGPALHQIMVPFLRILLYKLQRRPPLLVRTYMQWAQQE